MLVLLGQEEAFLQRESQEEMNLEECMAQSCAGLTINPWCDWKEV